eukprot:283448-Amphidinium_carterae.2
MTTPASTSTQLPCAILTWSSIARAHSSTSRSLLQTPTCVPSTPTATSHLFTTRSANRAYSSRATQITKLTTPASASIQFPRAILTSSSPARAYSSASRPLMQALTCVTRASTTAACQLLATQAECI